MNPDALLAQVAEIIRKRRIPEFDNPQTEPESIARAVLAVAVEACARECEKLTTASFPMSQPSYGMRNATPTDCASAVRALAPITPEGKS